MNDEILTRNLTEIVGGGQRESMSAGGLGKKSLKKGIHF